MILLLWACKTRVYDSSIFVSENMAFGVACELGIDEGWRAGQEAGWACTPLETLEVPSDLTDYVWFAVCGGFVPEQLSEESQYWNQCVVGMRYQAELCYTDGMTTGWYTAALLADCLPTCVQE